MKRTAGQQSVGKLGFDVGRKESISFDEIVGTKLMLISNDRYIPKPSIGSLCPYRL